VHICARVFLFIVRVNLLCAFMRTRISIHREPRSLQIQYPAVPDTSEEFSNLAHSLNMNSNDSSMIRPCTECRTTQIVIVNQNFSSISDPQSTSILLDNSLIGGQDRCQKNTRTVCRKESVETTDCEHFMRWCIQIKLHYNTGMGEGKRALKRGKHR